MVRNTVIHVVICYVLYMYCDYWQHPDDTLNTLTGKKQHWLVVLLGTYKHTTSSSKKEIANHYMSPNVCERESTIWGFCKISPLRAKNTNPVPQKPYRAAVLLLCGLSVAWGPSVVLQHLCYWYHSLSHFSCLGEAQASKFGPTDPVLLSAALNINTCLWGPINTWYREEAVKERTNVHEDGKWGSGGKEKEWERLKYKEIRKGP